MRLENISSQRTIDDLVKAWQNIYQDVKKKNNNSITLKYQGARLRVSRKKGIYHVEPTVPLYPCFILAGLVFPILFGILLAQHNPSLIPSLNGALFGSLVVGFVPYWIYAEIYSAKKRGEVLSFSKQAKI